MPGSYILRIKRLSGQKEDNKNKFILETMLASDVLITNASENIKFHLSEGSECTLVAYRSQEGLP
jgi:hypothetical protein